MAEGEAILVLEHNPRNRELLQRCLGQEGYRVLPGDSVEACELALSAETVALVLVDVAGFDLQVWDCCERLKARHIPFLVLSAHADRRQRECCLSHGACSVLDKPVTMHELLAAVAAMLRT